MSKLHVAYDDVYLDWKLGNGDGSHPTNPIRAQFALNILKEDYDVEVVKPNADVMDKAHLQLVHDSQYISRVIDSGHSGEWYPDDKHKGRVALEMFAGTVRLAEKILSGEAKVAFNPQGAKHHAQYDHSSGFCVFNDMAWAARHFTDAGYKVMYIDWDAHHGDGVENLLYDFPDIVTCSIHDGTVFPGTGRDGHKPEQGVYNWALPEYSGDEEFMKAMDEIEDLADTVQPDIILLAAGADGHKTDPLATLQFDYPGYKYASQAVARIANKYSQGRILIGGAGGYQPIIHTPYIWAGVVSWIYDDVIQFNNSMKVPS
jgi:acetoin utilization protein AcuC